MLWQDCKSSDIEAMPRDRVVVFPVAAIEQHSLHMPISTDSTIATAIASRLDEAKNGNLLILPTFWLGCSKHHQRYPGTLTTELDHWSACVYDVAVSVLRHGFTKMVILNCHGGNGSILAVTLEKIKYDYPDAKVIGATYWQVARDAMAEVRESGLGGMGHACEMETSVMLALRPELVDMNRAEKDGKMPQSSFSRFDMLNGPKVTIHRTFEELTHHGGYGDPTIASAEKGERFLNAAVDRLAAMVTDLENGTL